jgi:hypothetical protein
MSELALKIPNMEERVLESQTLSAGAMAIQVMDQATLIFASDSLLSVMEGLKAIKETHKDNKRFAKQAHATACALERDHMAILAPAERYLRQQISAYQLKQEKIRIEAERKAREKADKLAEKERLKKEKQADNLEAKGHADLANERRAEAADVFAEPVAVAKPEASRSALGTVSGRKDIEIEILKDPDKIRAFCRAVADGIIPVGCISIKTSEVKAHCKANIIKPGPYHGVIVKEKFITMARGR